MTARLAFTNAVSTIVKELSKNSLIFFVGSGVSTNKPTSIPSSYKLKCKMFNIMKQSIGEKVLKQIPFDKSQNRILELPFESFMQSIHFVIGNKALFLLSFMQKSPFNLNHANLIALASLSPYRAILTTNFDTMLEKASFRNSICIYRDEQFRKICLPSNNDKITIIKLHGSSKSINSLSAILSKIGRPMMPHKVKVFNKICSGSTLVVLGYSGGDPDIMPIFEEVKAKKIIWVCRNRPSLGASDAIKRLEASGKIIIVISDLSRLLKACVKTLKLHRPKVEEYSISTDICEIIKSVWNDITLHSKMACLARLSYDANEFELADKIYSWLNRHIPRDNLYFYRKASVYDKLGDIAYRIRNFSLAKLFWMRELSYAEKGNYDVFKSSALANLGALEYQRMNYNKAIKFLKRGLIKEKTLTVQECGIHKWMIMGNLRQNLGLVFLDTRQFRKALSMLKSAYKIYKHCGDIIMASMSTIDYEMTRAKLGKKIDIQRLEDALFILKNYAMKEQQAVGFLTAAKLWFMAGEIKKGETYLRQSIKNAKTAGDKDTLIEASLCLLKQLWGSRRKKELRKMHESIRQIMNGS